MALFKPGKKYGLIIPKKKEEQQTRVNPLKGSNMNKPSIFGADSSDSDNEEGGSDWVAKSMKVKANNAGLKKQAKLQMSKALEEDPTVFQYDEVYDDIEQKKVVEKESKKEVDRKPKYMHNLLKAADERNKEFERRIERQVQKEREAEGEMYADKESFVTSAYRKKMEEIAKQEEEEARQAQIEAALDVTKQNNMDGFYRHLYRQTMGEEKEQVEARKKLEKPEETEEQKAARIKEELKKVKIQDVDKKEEEDDTTDTKTIKKIDKKKGFRKKEVEESSSDEDSSSGESDDESNVKTNDNPGLDVPMSAEEKFEQRKKELREQREKREKRKRKIEQDASSSESEDETEVKKSKDSDDSGPEEKDGDNVTEVKPEETKPKINIWEKRTVGEVFDDAVKRYWERRAAREAGR